MRETLAVLLVFLAGCASASPPIDTVTFRIGTIDGGLCSATAVAADVLLTAKHCIKDTDDALLLEGKAVAILRQEADAHDHVLLRLRHNFRAWAKPGPSVKVGQDVQMRGNVEGFNQFYRRGYVAGWYGSALMMDMEIGKGDSGAGIFNMKGELVGVVSAVYKGPHARFAVAYPLAFSPKQLEILG